jgi:chemotaxis protein MotB
MARRKKGHVGGQGWFVTFADLMALLMSFFVMVAAYSTQDQRKLQIVAGSMRDAFGVNPESRFAGIIEVDGIPTASQVKNLRDVPPEQASDHTTPNDLDRREDGLSVTSYDRGFGLAAASLRQALRDMPEILDISRNVIIEETKDGLDISLVDQDGRAMFPEGATYPYERTRLVLAAIAPVVRRMPNRITISGHTSAPRPGVLRPGRARDPGSQRPAQRALRRRHRQGRHRADVPRQPLCRPQPPRDDHPAQRSPARRAGDAAVARRRRRLRRLLRRVAPHR